MFFPTYAKLFSYNVTIWHQFTIHTVFCPFERYKHFAFSTLNIAVETTIHFQQSSPLMSQKAIFFTKFM